MFCYIFRLSSNNHIAKFGVRATTTKLYPGRDTFEFDQGHVTKNQPITVLILLSESLELYNKVLCSSGIFEQWRTRGETCNTRIKDGVKKCIRWEGGWGNLMQAIQRSWLWLVRALVRVLLTNHKARKKVF